MEPRRPFAEESSPALERRADRLPSKRDAFGFANGLDEYAIVGYRHDKPAAFAIGQQDADSIRLVKQLEGGTTIDRTLRLPADNLGWIHFKTVITHRDTPERVYQFHVRCDFREPPDVRCCARMWAFAHSSGWREIPSGWYAFENTAASFLYGRDVDALAILNSDVNAGIIARFDKTRTYRPQLALKAIKHRADLELLTDRFTLKDGESVEYAHALEFTPTAPKD